jgi:hypothetical protein
MFLYLIKLARLVLLHTRDDMPTTENDPVSMSIRRLTDEVIQENALVAAGDMVSTDRTERKKELLSKISDFHRHVLKTEREVSMLDTIILGMKEDCSMTVITKSLEKIVKDKRIKCRETYAIIEQMSAIIE